MTRMTELVSFGSLNMSWGGVRLISESYKNHFDVNFKGDFFDSKVS